MPSTQYSNLLSATVIVIISLIGCDGKRAGRGGNGAVSSPAWASFVPSKAEFPKVPFQNRGGRPSFQVPSSLHRSLSTCCHQAQRPPFSLFLSRRVQGKEQRTVHRPWTVSPRRAEHRPFTTRRGRGLPGPACWEGREGWQKESLK